MRDNPVRSVDRSGFQQEPAAQDRAGRDKDSLLGPLMRSFGFSKANQLEESFTGENTEVLYQAREVRAKALQASGDAAVTTAETILMVQPTPEAEEDALSKTVIEKVAEKASSRWSKLGQGLKSFFKAGEDEVSTLTQETESLFRRMSFGEATSTLTGGLQASTKDTQSWVSTDAFYSHMFPPKQGSGQYDEP